MSLSEDLRNELAAIAPVRACCRLAELSALFHAAGRLHIHGRGALSVHLDLPTIAVARRAFSLLRGFGVAAEIRSYAQRAFGRATRYQLHVEGDERALALLRDAGVVGTSGAPLERPPKRVVGRACCRGAYLRGALLGGGSLSGPHAPHLEARTTGVEGAKFLAQVAAAEDVELRVHDRGRHGVAYARGSEAIADALALAGASEAALRLDEHAVIAGTRSRANRLANADHANLVRTGRAAHAQLEAIRAVGVDALPAELQEVAELRLKYPAASLSELATKAGTTKASVHRRLRRIVHLAQAG